MENIIKPWGYEQILEKVDWDSSYRGPTIKNLVILAGHKISLQYHFKRNEDWEVLHGECRITIGNSIYLGLPGTKWHIPIKVTHRVEAITNTVIREESDNYDSKDIKRLNDDYGRIEDK